METKKVAAHYCDSPASLNGLKYAVSFSERIGAELHPFQTGVVDSEVFHRKMNGGNLYEATSLSSEDFKVAGGGSGAQAGMEIQPDLIITGTEDYSPERGFYIDPCTQKFVDHSRYPVLIVPPEFEFSEIGTVVIGSDMDENNFELLHHVVSLLGPFNPEIILLLFDQEHSNWSYCSEVNALIERLRKYTGYLRLSGKVCDCRQSNGTELESFLRENKADLFCIDSRQNLFWELVSQDPVKQRGWSTDIPVLVFPDYMENDRGTF